MNRLPWLRFLCRCLGTGGPEALRSLEAEIDSQRVMWEPVVELASESYMTPTLYCALRDKGLLAVVPADLREYLESSHALNRDRNRRLVAQAYEVAAALNVIGIEPVLMKGAGSVLAGVYPDAGLRMSEDLDLLIPEERLQDAWQALTAQGYTPFKPGCYHHLDALQRQGRIAAVELHRCPPQHERHQFLSTEEIRFASELFVRDGARVLVPSASYRVIIAVSHGYMLHESATQATFMLRDLYDLFLHLQPGPGEGHVDWELVGKCFDRTGPTRRALGKALSVAERLFGCRLPYGVASRIPGPWFWYACLFRFRYPRLGQIVLREADAVYELLANSSEGQVKRRNLSRPGWYVDHLKSLVRDMKSPPKP